MLERAPQAFRRGYRDARKAGEAALLVPGTFAEHDYTEGYAAAVTEMLWEVRREAKRLDDQINDPNWVGSRWHY